MPTSNLADQLLGDPDRLKALLSALATGADLAIAAGLVMFRKRDLQRALTENEELAPRVEHANCQFQLSQQRPVHVAARNERNRKCAIWLLEFNSLLNRPSPSSWPRRAYLPLPGEPANRSRKRQARRGTNAHRLANPDQMVVEPFLSPVPRHIDGRRRSPIRGAAAATIRAIGPIRGFSVRPFSKPSPARKSAYKSARSG